MFAASMKCVVSLVMLVCYLLLSFAISPLFLILLLSLVTLPSWMSAYNTWNSRWTLATNRKSLTPINTVSFTECEFYKSTSTVFDKQQFSFAEGNEPNKSEYTVCPDWLVWPDGVSMNLRLWMPDILPRTISPFYPLILQSPGRQFTVMSRTIHVLSAIIITTIPTNEPIDVMMASAPRLSCL